MPERTTPCVILRCRLVQNYVTVGVSIYEAVAAAGTLSVEHTSVAEILATVAR